MSDPHRIKENEGIKVTSNQGGDSP
jgi:hypothetical protein